ncbi:glycosyl transferase [Amycolatopsis antarctica]|uniref:Glycosyl transferase n=1 Tax=Amycolatopsis antarctica TaxID=1854586 RepID=A0A263D2C8_9PSEU|nr:glycosyltransferase [Amycolatopsis antarctica]OZM71646.1 glycosyl transferase [Amycolatopsis antarctica]
MGRFLFVVPPLVGHVNPAVGTAGALAARGHEVAWAGHEELVRHLAGADAKVFDCVVPEGGLARTADLKGPAALQFLWEEFLIPLADAMAPGVRSAIETFAPDVVVADQQAVAGGLIAESLGLTWVTSATTPAELIDPLDGLPKVAAWLDGLIEDLRGRIADGAGTADPRMSPHGVLGFTTRELLGQVELGERTWLVGPSITDRPSTSDFPWEWLDSPLPTVLVTLGTTNLDAGAAFLNAAAEALSTMDGRVRAVILDPAGVLGEVGDNVLVRAHAPQLLLLERLDAVVCHSGHNTVCESLWHGVPLVVAPIRDDQPIVAGQVVDAGAGVRLRFGRSGPARIAAAIDAVLDPAGGHREAACRIGESFRAAGGGTAAAGHLEGLLERQPADAGAARG